ncbi:trypsin-1 [Stomoxys calcitrans]|uniref:trypsin-1 n=1 Tax=Stomoxys calcitrans TaxID=35570 RepID=UPI0027E28F2F|nr:trypsin-1 [Stomoxys calcitrans]
MYSQEDLRKIFKIVLVVMLCCEMQPSDTQLDTYEDRILYNRHDLNGTEASFNNTKYHASIRLKEKDQHYGVGHMCSGALIAPSVVLTTASCVYNYDENKPYHPSELKVVLGSMARYQRHEQTLIYSVTHSYQPATFDAEKLRDNLAILMLERDIPAVNEHIKPITLQPYNTNWYDKESDKQFKVTTWLKTPEGLFLNPLMFLDATHVGDKECKQQYGHLYGPGMLCMKTSTPMVLTDVGSPLFVDNKLMGLMSFTMGTDDSAVYTDITYHSKWIAEHIGNGHNQNSSVWGMLGFLTLTWIAVRRSKYFKL